MLFICIFFIPLTLSTILELEAETTPLVFVQFSDVQIGCPAVDSLGRTSTARFKKLINVLNSISETFDFAINVGDINVGNGTSEVNWMTYFNIVENATFDVFEVRGNHDGAYDNSLFEQYTGDKIQYSFKAGNIQFVFIGGWEYPLFRGTCGVEFSPEQEQWIRATKEESEGLSIWAVCHFPLRGENGNYWSNISLSEEFSTDILGYSCGHEDNNRYIDVEGGWIELNSYGVDSYSGPDGLYFEKVTIGKSYVKIEHYNADDMVIESTQTINVNTKLDIKQDQLGVAIILVLCLIAVSILLIGITKKIKQSR